MKPPGRTQLLTQIARSIGSQPLHPTPPCLVEGTLEATDPTNEMNLTIDRRLGHIGVLFGSIEKTDGGSWLTWSRLFLNLWGHLAVGQNQWYHFGVGVPPILESIVVRIGMFTWGYGILTHGHLCSTKGAGGPRLILLRFFRGFAGQPLPQSSQCFRVEGKGTQIRPVSVAPCFGGSNQKRGRGMGWMEGLDGGVGVGGGGVKMCDES